MVVKFSAGQSWKSTETDELFVLHLALLPVEKHTVTLQAASPALINLSCPRYHPFSILPYSFHMGTFPSPPLHPRSQEQRGCSSWESLEAAALVTGSWTVKCFGLLGSALAHGLLCWWVVKHLLCCLSCRSH